MSKQFKKSEKTYNKYSEDIYITSSANDKKAEYKCKIDIKNPTITITPLK